MMRSDGLEMLSSSSGILSYSFSGASIIALNLKGATNWWLDVNVSPVWQDRIFHTLAVLYGILSVVVVIALWLVLSWLHIYHLSSRQSISQRRKKFGFTKAEVGG